MTKRRTPSQAKQESENEILRTLAGKSQIRWSELLEKTRLSSRTLKKALNRMERKGSIFRKMGSGPEYPPPVYYGLKDQALEMPSLRILYFEIFAYNEILRELLEEGLMQTILKEAPTGRGKEKLVHWDLSPEYLENKNEIEIAKAIDNWLTPIILYAIVQEQKSNRIEWTQAISGLIDRIMILIKQKDISKFEDALKTVYSNRTSAYSGVPVIYSLNRLVERVEKRKQVSDLFDSIWKQREEGQ